MTQKRSRTREEIFADMHRELRAWNPKIPESPERLDPILRILLQLYSHQLSQIDQRIDKVWDVAAGSLVKSLCPESKRWPVPAFTVMRARPTDPVVEVDAHTKFFHKEEREGGQTFYFSPLKKERLLSAEVKNIYLKMDKSLIDLSPSQEESSTTHQRIQTLLPAGDTARIYIAVDSESRASEFNDAALFLKGIPDALKQLRWAYWYPGNNAGGFHEDCGFCPGLTSSIERMFMSADRATADWGGLRSSTDLFRSLEDNFVTLPEVFASTWELGPVPSEIVDPASSSGISVPPGEEHYHWIRLDLPGGGNKSSIQSPFEVFFNCFVAVNKNELTIFKHTGGNRLVEIELPEDISSILEITDVIDSNGRAYGMKHEILDDPSKKFYSLEDRNDKLVLWFDFTSHIELPPDSITLNYSVTSGTSANGIEAGKVNELYESHPGIVEVENIIPVSGAIPAKTEEQILTEVSARLRNRDRVLSFAEIANWARTFDPRIKKVACRNGVERAERGVRRCIIAAVTLKATDFYSDDEVELLKTRLNNFLKARSPVNSRYQIEIEKI